MNESDSATELPGGGKPIKEAGLSLLEIADRIQESGGGIDEIVQLMFDGHFILDATVTEKLRMLLNNHALRIESGAGEHKSLISFRNAIENLTDTLESK